MTSAWTRRRAALWHVADWLDEQLPLRLTLLVLLLRPPGEGSLRGATWAIAGAALAVPRLARSCWVWFALALLIGARVVDEFPLADNHIYLLGYWCLGVGLVLLASAQAPETRGALLGAMSRRLVGAAFVCAVVWKGLLSADYLDTRFFRVTLVTDDRFATLARAVGGLTDEELAGNREALAPMPAGVEVLSGPTLVEPPALRRLAGALTWGGFALEALLAVAFLAAGPRLLVRARHPALLLFCAATYAIAPVAGFGWLLAILGMSQQGPRMRELRVAYAALCAVILVYAETPVLQWGLGLAAR